MSTIVQRWSGIQNGNYLNKDLNVGNKTGKDSLSDVFNASFAQLGTQQIADNEAIIKAASNIYDRYTKAYESANFFAKVYFTVAGFFGFSLTGSYNQLIDRLALAAANNVPGNTRQFSTRFLQAGSLFEEEFLKKVTNYAEKKIEELPQNRGIIYQVTNSKGITSYLIGTIHYPNNGIAENKQMKELVEKSSELFTEIGDNWLTQKNVFTQRHLQLLGYKKVLDYELIAVAQDKNIPTRGLESLIEHFMKALIFATSKTNFDYSAHPDQVRRQKFRESNIKKLELLEAWKNGNEQTVATTVEELHPRQREPLLDFRNYNWLTGESYESKGGIKGGLIEKLRNADAPVSVAVGSAHLVGQFGLVQGLRDSGLTVTRLPSAS